VVDGLVEQQQLGASGDHRRDRHPGSLARIDLREAELADGAEILATAVMGAVTVTVRPGVSVELSGFALMGGNSGPDDKTLPLPDAPVVHVRGYSLMGGVVVERKKPRER
jgi:hypothetical protein